MFRTIPSYSIRLTTFFLVSIWFLSCSEGNPELAPVANEHNPPTTMTVVCIALDPAGLFFDTTAATVRDTTVAKGKPPVEGFLHLKSDMGYACEIFLYDESRLPAVDVTPDIIIEKEGHMFVWTPTKGIDTTRLKIHDLEKDANGAIFGRTGHFRITSGASASGMLNIVLRHYDSLNKNDVLFDTDVDRDVPVKID